MSDLFFVTVSPIFPESAECSDDPAAKYLKGISHFLSVIALKVPQYLDILPQNSDMQYSPLDWYSYRY